jgi:hypothetical protein
MPKSMEEIREHCGFWDADLIECLADNPDQECPFYTECKLAGDKEKALEESEE